VWTKSHNHPAEAIKFIRQFAYDVHLRHFDTKHQEGQEEETEAPTPRDEVKLEARYDELEELLQFAEKHHTIRHFLQAMARLKEQAEETSKNKRDCVSLMTVHKSKGLENPVVFVVGLTESIFPHRRSTTMLAEDGPIILSGMAEERRLAYVAFTRAQKLLFLSSIRRYRNSDAIPSRFIQEAGLAPTDEDGVLNPYLFHMDGRPRTIEKELAPLSPVEIPTLFDE
jgi:superfamily I DNA/RNA helicase